MLCKLKVVSSKQLLPNIEDYFCNINYVCLKYPSDVWVTVCLLNLRKVVTPFPFLEQRQRGEGWKVKVKVKVK